MRRHAGLLIALVSLLPSGLAPGQESSPEIGSEPDRTTVLLVVRAHEASIPARPLPLARLRAGSLLPRFELAAKADAEGPDIEERALAAIWDATLLAALESAGVKRLALGAPQTGSELLPPGFRQAFPDPPPPLRREIEIRASIRALLDLESETADDAGPSPLDRQVQKALGSGYRVVTVRERGPELPSPWLERLQGSGALERAGCSLVVLDLAPGAEDGASWRGSVFLRGEGLRPGWVHREPVSPTRLGATLLHLLAPELVPDPRKRDVLDEIFP